MGKQGPKLYQAWGSDLSRAEPPLSPRSENRGIAGISRTIHRVFWEDGMRQSNSCC